MSSTAAGRTVSSDRYSGGAVGVIVFAAVLMILGGVFHAVQGLVALVNDDFYVFGQEYVFEFDVTAWGWIHLLAGILVVTAGCFLLQGAVWARTVAVVVATLSIILNFMWMPFYPLWSMLVIGFDVLVIWAVTVHGRDVTEV
jgi:hypothetical protein